ncbi:hypothetical protein [Halorubrum sp. Ea8]|uniref:hypothetical protein n=1 Tax=Halorubrum sp. Ea8 TaxID=1383841 RepID=UPI000B97E82C|nr:hypothetical protein [Halorubrum sp. Ea8]OYR45147.1 hypothetical protein DJ74_16530 [Halorubrum sp. Ea8]
MGDSKKWTRRAAVGSLASGGGLMLFGTGGSTQISTYRDVEVNAGDGDDAILEFNDQSDGKTIKIGSPAVVYTIKDNVDTFSDDDINVTATVGTKSITAAVSNDSSPFEVTVSCAGEASGLNGLYDVELNFEALAPDFTITATRTPRVDFDCYDFGDENNYRDSGDKGQANQPTDPRGLLRNPEKVNNPGDVTTAVSEGNKCETGSSGGNGGPSGRVGYALPSIKSHTEYELYIKYENSTGSWNAHLVNGSGTKLNEELSITGGGGNTKEKTLQFNDNQFIRDNADDLYLIFETTSNGNCVSVDIDYFELRSAGNSN